MPTDPIDPEAGTPGDVALADVVDLDLAGRRIVRPPPRRGETDTVWRAVEADLPAVLAELAALAPGFALAPAGDGAWSAFDAGQSLAIDVVAVADGKHAAVGVRIEPPVLRRIPPIVPAAVMRQIAVLGVVGLWLILALALWIAAVPLPWLLIGPTGVVVLLVGVLAGFLAISAIGERAHRRSRDAWVAAWHRDFWPALAARLAEGQPYR